MVTLCTYEYIILLAQIINRPTQFSVCEANGALLPLSIFSIGSRNHLRVSECSTGHVECVGLFWLVMHGLITNKKRIK